MGEETKCDKKKISKAYEEYSKKFTPKPTYFANCIKAFLVGGLVCTIAMVFNDILVSEGLSNKIAGTYTTITLIAIAQLLTGIGVFDTIAKFAGAGVIIPITGFANSIVAPAIEYKREGPVLGTGAKLFTIAGPVLVCGISAAVVVGVIYWIVGEI